MNSYELLKRQIKDCTYLSHETRPDKTTWIKCIVKNNTGGKDTISLEIKKGTTLKEIKDAIEQRRGLGI